MIARAAKQLQPQAKLEVQPDVSCNQMSLPAVCNGMPSRNFQVGSLPVWGPLRIVCYGIDPQNKADQGICDLTPEDHPSTTHHNLLTARAHAVVEFGCRQCTLSFRVEVLIALAGSLSG